MSVCIILLGTDSGPVFMPNPHVTIPPIRICKSFRLRSQCSYAMSLQEIAPARLPPKMPMYRLDKGKHTSSIDIAGWRITATKRTISNAQETEA